MGGVEIECLKSSPIWVFFLPGEDTALTRSPEGAGTWWFLIWGMWGEIDVKKQTQVPTGVSIDKCFRLTFSPVKSLLCSLPSVLQFWKFLFLLKLLAKLSTTWINCRWMFISLLVITPCGNSQTLRTVLPGSRCTEDSSTWSARDSKLWAASLASPSLIVEVLLHHVLLTQGGDGNKTEWTKGGLGIGKPGF